MRKAIKSLRRLIARYFFAILFAAATAAATPFASRIFFTFARCATESRRTAARYRPCAFQAALRAAETRLATFTRGARFLERLGAREEPQPLPAQGLELGPDLRH